MIFRKTILISLFCFSVLSGFFWNFRIFGEPVSNDQIVYDGVARDLIERGRFTFRGQSTFIEPVYPIFLEGIYKIFGYNLDAVRVIQIFLFGLTVIFSYLTAEKLIGARLAAVVSLALAGFYGLATQAGVILTESLFTFFVVLFGWLLYQTVEKNNYFWPMMAGLILGLTALSRGIVQYLAVPVVIFLFLHHWRQKKAAAAKSLLIIAAFSAVIIPWLLRSKFESSNAALAPRGGELLITRAELMENVFPKFWSHLTGHLFGYYIAQFFDDAVTSTAYREAPLSEAKIDRLRRQGLDYGEIDELLSQEGKQRMLNQPIKFIAFSLLDFISFNSPIIPEGYYWQNSVTVHPMFAEGRHPEIPDYLKILIVLGLRFVWLALIILVAYGAVVKRSEWKKFGPLLVVIIYFNVIYSLVHAIPRYALPIYPFYFILAAGGVSSNPVIYNRIRSIFIFFLCFFRFLKSGRADKRIGDPKNFLVVQLAGVGDMICTTPVFRAIKQGCPSSQLFVLGIESNRLLLEGNEDVDQFITYSDDFWKLLDKIKKQKFDFAAITSPRFNILAALYLSGIPLIVTPAIKGGFSPYETKLYKMLKKFVVARNHQMGRLAAGEYLKMLEPVSIDASDTAKHLSYSPAGEAKILDFFAKQGVYPAGDFIVGISPSSGNKIKNWPAPRFAQLADYLAEKHKAKIIIVGAGGDLQETTEMLTSLKPTTKVVNAVGAFDLGELKALIAKLDLFISIDTGPIYIAEAFKVPTVDIVGPIDEREQPPVGPLHRIVVAPRRKPELYVMNARVYDAKEAKRQVDDISPEMVITELEKLIPLILKEG